MKKLIVTGIICALLLCACSSEQSVSGQVIEVIRETENELAQFIILTDEEEKAIIRMDEETFVMSWVVGIDTEGFKNGEMTDVEGIIAVLYENEWYLCTLEE